MMHDQLKELDSQIAHTKNQLIALEEAKNKLISSLPIFSIADKAIRTAEESVHHPVYMSRECFLRDLRTATINYGRRQGYTTYIQNRAGPNDAVIMIHYDLVRQFNKK